MAGTIFFMNWEQKNRAIAGISEKQMIPCSIGIEDTKIY